MKDTYQIWFDAGKMMGFKMPEFDRIKCLTKCEMTSCNKDMCYEFYKLIRSARAASLPVSEESEEKVKRLIQKVKLGEEALYANSYLDQTKSYQIEAEFREWKEVISGCRYSKCDCASLDECFEYQKVLVLVEP